MKLLLVLLCVGQLAFAQDDPVFEEISPDFSDMPDALGGEADDIGTPDPLDGSDNMDTPIFGDEDVKLDLDAAEEPIDQSPDALNENGLGFGEVNDGGDLSLPSDTGVESQNLNIPLGPVRSPTQPNYDKERYFNKIYRDFNEKPVTPEEWRQFAQERKGEAYAVQRGDTLWDISTTFFGEGGYWPKVWSLNQAITNPHKIEPEQRLIFYPGNLDDEPMMEIDEAKKAMKAEQGIPDSVDIPDGLDIPPPRKNPNRVIGIPESLPFLRTFTLEKPDYSAPAIGSPTERRPSNQAEVTTYFDEQLPAPIGEVIDVEFGGKTATQFQYVYVRAEGGPPNSAVVYNVAETFFDEDDDDKVLGHIIQIQGTVGQATVVNANENVYRMMVTRTVHPITVGSRLFSGGIQSISTLKSRSPKVISGQVFGGQFEKNRRLYGTGGIVFINAGASAGVAVGDIIQIVANPAMRHENAVEIENFRPIASVKAIYVSGNVTTALVLDASEAIRTGDFSGQPSASMFPAGGGVGGDEGLDEDEVSDSFEEFEDTQQIDDFGDGGDEFDAGEGEDDFGDDFGDDSEEDFEEF